jgi:hypothetical protein
VDRGRVTRNRTWNCFCVMEGWWRRFPDAVEAFVIIVGVFCIIAAMGEAMNCLLSAAADGGGNGSPCRIEEVGGEG